MKAKYQRCLLKLSGEALGNPKAIYDGSKLKDIVSQVITLVKQGISIAIVIGGGNIWRGQKGAAIGMDKVISDYMGMLATVMNCLALEAEFKNQKFDKVVIQSAIEMNKLCEPYYFKKCIARLNAGYVVILAAGTGHPYFTTDTAAVLRAAEVKADVILMAKNGIDGVYDDDPNVNANAKRYEFLTYDEITSQKLRVMDLTATTMAMEANLKLLVFDINEPNNIINAVYDRAKATLITKEREKQDA